MKTTTANVTTVNTMLRVDVICPTFTVKQCTNDTANESTHLLESSFISQSAGPKPPDPKSNIVQ